MKPTSLVSFTNRGLERLKVVKAFHLKMALGMSLALAAAGSQAQMAVKGKLLLQDDFKTLEEYTKVLQSLTNGWQVRVWHATWKRTTDGIESRWESGHNPVLGYEGPFSNVVIEVDFRYRRDADAARNAYLRVNPANRQLDPRAYTVSAWANANSKARPRGLVLEHEEWRTQGYQSVATQPGHFESDTWYTMRLEIIGDQALAACNGFTVSGSYERFGLPKTLLVLAVGKCSHELRHLRIYEASPNPQWTTPRVLRATVPIESLPDREPLSAAIREKLNHMTPVFDGQTLNGWVQAPARLLREDAYRKELAKSANSAWVARDGVLASTGVGRGVLYSEKDYTNYRLTFLVRQRKGNHFPGVLLFCQRPPAGEAGLDALGGIQFAVPSAGHWDYRPGINRSGEHFRRPFRVGFNLQEWTQVEILVNGDKGSARMALAQPPGTRGFELLRFDDPSVVKAGPIALQMHNAQLFDEYKDLRIEENPKEPDLLWTIQ